MGKHIREGDLLISKLVVSNQLTPKPGVVYRPLSRNRRWQCTSALDRLYNPVGVAYLSWFVDHIRCLLTTA